MDDCRFLPRSRFQDLIEQLRDQGYRVLGPRMVDGAIQLRDLDQASQLPVGWTDDQAPAHYHLTEVDSTRCFAWAVGPQGLKPFLFAPRETLWSSRRADDGQLTFSPTEQDAQPIAAIGVRACDLAALQLQDRHFQCTIRDPYYAARRAELLVIAVHCGFPADTCFCVSTGDGPRAVRGFDIALGELDDGFVVEIGSERGESIVTQLDLAAADDAQIAQMNDEISEAERRQFRQLPSHNLRRPLFERLQHPRWDDVAARCLACGNCTSVCPTCFCHAELDVPALGGESSDHIREWDSCFSAGHAYLHGFNVRPDTHFRYRQWLTHKLGSWHEQYGRSGCVGCGRCITWCPAAIDITEEANAICADGEERQP